MKNFQKLFVALVALSSAQYVMAGNEITVSAGDASVLKTANEAKIVVDTRNTIVVEMNKNGKHDDEEAAKPLQEYLKDRGNDFVADFPNVVATGINFFQARIYSKLQKKGGVKVAEISNPTHEFRIIIDELDYGNSATSIIANVPGISVFATGFSGRAGGMIIKGRVEYVNLSTGMAEVVFDIPHFRGYAESSDKRRMGSLLYEVASKIVKFANKGVSNGEPVKATE